MIFARININDYFQTLRGFRTEKSSRRGLRHLVRAELKCLRHIVSGDDVARIDATIAELKDAK